MPAININMIIGCVSRTSSTSSEEEGEIIEEGDSDDDFVHLQEGSERERIFQDQVTITPHISQSLNSDMVSKISQSMQCAQLEGNERRSGKENR